MTSTVLIPLIGIAIGATGGLFIGEMSNIWFEGETLDLRVILALFGTLVGYFAARYLSRFMFSE